MTYIEPAPAPAQEPSIPTAEIIPGARIVVTDFRSRERWKAEFRAVALANDYTKTEILLAGALADNFYCKTGKCDPGFEKLAAQINAGVRTIKLAAKTLEADGWCIRKRGGRDEKVNFTLTIPTGISAAMPALMEDANADSISAEIGHFPGSISANTLAPLNTEVEQRRSAAASPSARAADDAPLNLASIIDIPDTKSAPTERRLVSNRVEKDQSETSALNATSYQIGQPAANAANGGNDMARIEPREVSFSKLVRWYPKNRIGDDHENNFDAFELALDHGISLTELIEGAMDHAIGEEHGREVPMLVEFLVSKCWVETPLLH